MLSRWTRGQVLLVVYGLTAVAWLSMFPLDPGDLEPVDLLYSGLSLLFAGGAAVVIIRLDLPMLELGWAVFTYSLFIRFLDELAEASEIFESLMPGTIRLVGLFIILLGFARTTNRLRLNLTERNERLAVLNRVLRHNLSNDLSTIILSLEYWSDRATDEDDEAVAAAGLEQTQELSDLSEKLRRIDDVITRAEQEGTQTHDLSAIAESAVAEFREKYPEVTFTVTTPSETLVEATAGLNAAVTNVVENACEHNDSPDPVVTVTVEQRDGNTNGVTIQDNGPGIPDHELTPIRDGEESALTHGSSVGLWFVFWVVELSGGTLSFEYDEGQRVTLEFFAAQRTVRSLDAFIVRATRWFRSIG